MGVFKRFYNDLRKERTLVENKELGRIYTSVIEKYNECMDSEEYINSFILIQSLMEDRLYEMYQLYKYETEGNWYELETYHKMVDLKRIVNELGNNQWIPQELKRNLITGVEIRNKHIHFSFMGLESYDKDLSESFYYLFREVDKLLQKHKQSVYNV